MFISDGVFWVSTQGFLMCFLSIPDFVFTWGWIKDKRTESYHVELKETDCLSTCCVCMCSCFMWDWKWWDEGCCTLMSRCLLRLLWVLIWCLCTNHTPVSFNVLKVEYMCRKWPNDEMDWGYNIHLYLYFILLAVSDSEWVTVADV